MYTTLFYISYQYWFLRLNMTYLTTICWICSMCYNLNGVSRSFLLEFQWIQPPPLTQIHYYSMNLLSRNILKTFSVMPWTAIPFSDIKSREYYWESIFPISGSLTDYLLTSYVIDPTGMILQCYADNLFLFLWSSRLSIHQRKNGMHCMICIWRHWSLEPSLHYQTLGLSWTWFSHQQG